jgi:hypothetical protein
LKKKLRDLLKQYKFPGDEISDSWFCAQAQRTDEAAQSASWISLVPSTALSLINP